MNVLSPTPYRNLFLAGLGIIIIAGWFSVGGHHMDEHFQVLEFANYKMGLSPLSDLPWEFASQCRPGFQPFIVFLLSKLLVSIGLFNPFRVVVLLHLLTGIISWYVCCRLILQLLPEFVSARGKQIFVYCSLFLWFVPYLSVRFSSENLSSQSLLLALSIILQIRTFPFRKQILGSLIVGFLLGFSLFIRLQIGFALLGLVAWFLLQKWSWKGLALMALSGLLAIGLCVIIDHWLYGAWVFSPFNYFYVNIVQHKAASFGVAPWWYYFSIFLQIAVPPISIVLMVLFFRGLYKKPLHLLSLVCFTFLIGHFLIGHKEMRFLYPASVLFIFVACIGLDTFLQSIPKKRIYSWLFGVLVFINCGLLIFRSFSPAFEIIKYYECIYHYCERQKTILAAFNQSPYTLCNEVNYYKHKNLSVQVLHTPEELQNVLDTANGRQVILFDNLPMRAGLEKYKMKRTYSLFPDWILNYNYNNWESRSDVSAIYEVGR